MIDRNIVHKANRMKMQNKIKNSEKTLFIFRRDLRIQDNIGLIYALKHAKAVIPCFIFTPEQINTNPYRGDHCLQFMIECLEDLEKNLESKGGLLYLFYDSIENILQKCIQQIGIDSVIVNRDYTAYSQQRDEKIAKLCKKYKVDFLSFEDSLLHSPEKTLKKDGTPYRIFTPYHRYVSSLEVQRPVLNKYSNYFTGNIAFSRTNKLYNEILPQRVSELSVHGGRIEGKKLLSKLPTFSDYTTQHDIPALDATTKLSAYLKFNVFSSREVYYSIVKSLGRGHSLTRALHWRDFFSTVALFYPHVFKGPFHKKFESLKWKNDKKSFKKWCEGQTGFPIVDAGMRELKATGFICNRLRMIVSSFLIKNLHVNWRWGEKYFANMLTDYDPAINNGNWQWMASTGVDSQPYFQLFNPWSQQKKFDPHCEYIKRWIPEIRELSNTHIHTWYKKHTHENYSLYPSPIIDAAKEGAYSIQAYSRLNKKF